MDRPNGTATRGITDSEKPLGSFAVIQLEGEASRWWRNLQADSHTTSWSSFIGAPRDTFELPPDPEEEDPEGDSEEDPEEDPKEDPEEDPEEDEEQPQQEFERYRALVEAWEPIPNESLEDYESRFISAFFSAEDLPKEFEERELCKVFWKGVPKPISIHGTSCEEGFDAQLENARRVWREWQERSMRRPHRIITIVVVRGRRRFSGASTSRASSTDAAARDDPM